MRWGKTVTLMTLMLIGELVFLLPFVVTRIFRPTFLTVFGINNFELGSAFSLYGIIAMGSYFLGGPIADRFSAKKILPFALLATSMGGIILATIPSLKILTILYGFWGLTTILLFWAGYVKVQRAFGGQMGQGKAFGMVDAGRGFVAAFIASTSVFLLDAFLPVSADNATPDQLSAALRSIILIFTVLTASGALLIWLFLPKHSNVKTELESFSFDGVKAVIGRKTVWLQALIVLCAYVGYKCTDDFSLYAQDAFGYNDVNAAHMATVSFWMRPVAAVAAGFLGDRFIHSRMVSISFGLMLFGSLVISSGVLEAGMLAAIIITIASTSAAIYGLRGLYFALFQEARLPLLITGSAAGVVSVVGYTPDIFMGPLMGILLDSNPGVLGHQYVFGVLAIFSVIGLLATRAFSRSV